MFKRDPRMFTILMIVFVQMLGASMALPILPLFAKREFQMDPVVITLLLSSFFAAQFLAGPYIGRLSDQYGRLPVLIVSQIGTVFSFLMLVLAQSIPMLFASRILDGITGGNIIVAQAYVTDITPRERRTQSLGLIFAAFGLGFTFGPALGGALSAAFGERIPFLIASVAAAATVWLTWRTLDESLTPEQRNAQKTTPSKGKLSIQEVFTNYPLMSILIITLIAQFGLGLLQSTFALYGEDVIFAGRDERTIDLGIGLLLGTVGVGQLFTQLVLLNRLVTRFGDAPMVVIGAFFRAIAMFIYASILTPWMGVPASVMFAMGSGLMMPALQSMVTNTVDDNVRGGALGFYQSSVSLATIFSTAFGGAIYKINPSMPYWMGGALALLTMIPAVMLVRWSAQRQAKVPA